MIIPKHNGRIMKEVKKYPNFILFEDPKTKVKKCFTYEELQREYEKPKGEFMRKPVQRKRFKNKRNVTCEQCANCMYAENGDMYCDEHEEFAYVYDEFCPTEEYMWCNGKKFIER